MFRKVQAFSFQNKNKIGFATLSVAVLSGAFFVTSCQKVSSNTPIASAPSSPIVLADGVRASYADIVERVAPAVVQIRAERRNNAAKTSGNPLEDFLQGAPKNEDAPPMMPMPNAPRGGRGQKEFGAGSGVIITTDGTVLTNHHVIEGAEKVTVELSDKRTFTAKVVGSDAPSDLAVLKLEAKDLPAMPIGDSNKVRVGDVVLAIGNPLGLGQTVTSGIISAKGRSTGGTGDGSFEDFLQTDAPINRGNSGGALVSLTGELIGINSQILSTSGGSIGIGFAIPSNMAKSVMDQLVSDGKVRRGQLGIVIQPVTNEMAEALKLPNTNGVIVSDIRAGSSADKAGVKRGDIILELNGEKITDGNSLRNKVASTKPGEAVNIKAWRDGKELELKANLDEFSADNEKSLRQNPLKQGDAEKGETQKEGSLGVELQPLTAAIAKELEIPSAIKGLVVVSVEEGSAAEDAGISPKDIILEINRQPVESLEDAKKALTGAEGKVLMLVRRGGQSIFLTVEPKK